MIMTYHHDGNEIGKGVLRMFDRDVNIEYYR